MSTSVVLVIEDEARLRENLVTLLKREGYEVFAAADGRSGLQQAKQQHPSVVLCDIKMDEMDGYAVLQQLRQDPATADISFIFLTGQVEQSQIRQGMNLGADDYLLKPFNPKELVQAIDSRLKRQAIRDDRSTEQFAANTEKLRQRRQAVQLDSQSRSSQWPRDPLTDLYHRSALNEILQAALVDAKNYDYPMAVLSLNVMRFGSINAAYGFGVGDLVLQQLAQRLQQQLANQGVVIRSNGDEFTIIIEHLTWEEDALQWADEIWRAATTEFQVEGRIVSLQIAIGGTSVQSGQSTPDELMLQADMARRSCEKWGGQVPYIFHDANLAAQNVEQRLLETDLNRAIQQGEFQMYYQPQVSLKENRIIGLEALLRWRHPYRGMVSPDRFITIAEEMGLIVPIGEWVLRTACLQVKQWQHLSPVPLKISVNLSIRQLQQENLASRITRILQAVDLHPCQLTLELTETNLMADIDQAIQTLECLRTLGIKIAIDDFGKGYSSLHYLSRLPIDILKIDQSFVRRLPDDSQAIAISNAIIQMAHDLHLDIVAEGVETEQQVKFLMAHGCEIMQGHLYSPAVAAAEFTTLLQQQQDLKTSNSKHQA